MASPFLGFPDWQRASGWDGPLLVNEANAAHAGLTVFGSFDVTRWQRIMGRFDSSVPCLIEFDWKASPTGPVIAGRQLVVHPNIAEPMAFNLVNLGPWLDVTIQPAASFTSNLRMFGTNRVSPRDLTPFAPQLIQQIASTLPASGALDLYSRGYFAGRARLWYFSNVSTTLTVQQSDNNGSWGYLDEIGTFAANVDQHLELLLPPAPVRLHFINQTAGAGLVWATLIADMEGA